MVFLQNIHIENTNTVTPPPSDIDQVLWTIRIYKEKWIRNFRNDLCFAYGYRWSFFSNNRNSGKRLMSNWNPIEIDKPFMYWDGDRYMATDSSSLGPQIDVVAMDKFRFKYFKKITRPDTLTTANSIGKVWYDKSNNNVEFLQAMETSC
jgi:hypothetical protein